jgi:hypothetical protein
MLVLIRDGVICPAVSNILLKRTSTTGCPQPTDGCAVCLSELSYSQHLDGSTCEAGLTPAKSPPSGVSCECSAEYGTSASMLLARRSGLATLSWTSIPGQSDLTLTLSADGQTCSTQYSLGSSKNPSGVSAKTVSTIVGISIAAVVAVMVAVGGVFYRRNNRAATTVTNHDDADVPLVDVDVPFAAQDEGAPACPSCHALCTDDMRFCRGCGSPM